MKSILKRLHVFTKKSMISYFRAIIISDSKKHQTTCYYIAIFFRNKSNIHLLKFITNAMSSNTNKIKFHFYFQTWKYNTVVEGVPQWRHMMKPILTSQRNVNNAKCQSLKSNNLCVWKEGLTYICWKRITMHLNVNVDMSYETSQDFPRWSALNELIQRFQQFMYSTVDVWACTLEICKFNLCL